MKLGREPVWIGEGCVFLGEIPDRLAFEERKPRGRRKAGGVWEDDYVMEDSAIAFTTSKGLFVVTGCSHSGICNIVEQAKAVCNETQIAGIIGGFHLFRVDERLEDTIRYLGRLNTDMLYPCHCVSFDVKAKMKETLPVSEVGTGLEIEL